MRTEKPLPESEMDLQYAADVSYRFIVEPRSDRTFRLVLEKRYYEWYFYGDSYDGYYDFDEPYYDEVYRCFVDTKEHAIELGIKLLKRYTAQK